MSSPVTLPAADARSSTLHVAVLGAGTVGREVVRALVARERDSARHGSTLRLAAVAVRDLDRAREGGIAEDLLSDAPAHLVADPAVDVVVELMGGDEPARTLIEAALSAGKAVVTANKHVLAHHGARLEAVARRSGAPLRFEASVGGGTPVLGPLARELAGSRVTRVRGIVNGTTNYILTELGRGGRDYAAVLADAQAAGYAESDPTADVDGLDAVNKLVILIRLAFGVWVDPSDLLRQPASTMSGRPGLAGISGVNAADLAAAGALDGTIKLVADASQAEPEGPVSASVLPTFVPLADPLARVSGVSNRIEVRADPLGSVAFSGPGAGGPATASAVVADLLAIERGGGSTWANLAPASYEPDRLIDPPTRARDRGWFVALPAGSPAPVAPPGAEVRTAPAAGGTGLLVRGADLDQVVAMVGSSAGVSYGTIYPADLAADDAL